MRQSHSRWNGGQVNDSLKAQTSLPFSNDLLYLKGRSPCNVVIIQLVSVGFLYTLVSRRPLHFLMYEVTKFAHSMVEWLSFREERNASAVSVSGIILNVASI